MHLRIRLRQEAEEVSNLKASEVEVLRIVSVTPVADLISRLNLRFTNQSDRILA
jgi:hypothetical protein